MDYVSPEHERAAVERERLEFEKQQASSRSWLETHLGAILSSAVALIAAVFTAGQIWVAHIGREKEIEITRLKNEAEIDRVWRIEMLGFLERHRERLFDTSTSTAREAFTLLELSFPAQYVQTVASKLHILTASTVVGDSSGVLVELLDPLIVELDRTKKAFQEYVSGDVANAEGELLRGNQRARDILVTRRNLIPEALRGDAAQLVEHYEVWLAEYARLRGADTRGVRQRVYAGPAGYPFPTEAERHFRAVRDSLAREPNAGRRGTSGS